MELMVKMSDVRDVLASVGGNDKAAIEAALVMRAAPPPGITILVGVEGGLVTGASMRPSTDGSNTLLVVDYDVNGPDENLKSFTSTWTGKPTEVRALVIEHEIDTGENADAFIDAVCNAQPVAPEDV